MSSITINGEVYMLSDESVHIIHELVQHLNSLEQRLVGNSSAPSSDTSMLQEIEAALDEVLAH